MIYYPDFYIVVCMFILCSLSKGLESISPFVQGIANPEHSLTDSLTALAVGSTRNIGCKFLFICGLLHTMQMTCNKTWFNLLNCFSNGCKRRGNFYNPEKIGTTTSVWIQH